MCGLSVSSPLLGVEYDTWMLWAAEQLKNKLAWSQFEMLPIFKTILRGGRARESSKRFFLASVVISLTTAFFFTFFLRDSLSSHPHQKTNLDQHKKEQRGDEMFSELSQTSKALCRRVGAGWTSCWENLTVLEERRVKERWVKKWSSITHNQQESFVKAPEDLFWG